MQHSLIVIFVLCLLTNLNTSLELTYSVLCDYSMHCENEIVEGEYLEFNINVFPENKSDTVVQGNYELSVISKNDRILEIKPKKLNFTGNEISAKNFSFTVKGIIIGRTKVNVTLTELSSGNETNETQITILKEKQYDLSVILSDSYLQFYFTLFVGIFVSLNNINMGCTLNLDVIRSVLKKPVAPAIGFASQFLFMPIMSMQIGKLLFPEQAAWRLGLFVFGCCPGGVLSNFWTLLFDGDVDLSVTMTFLSECAALGMMPFWLFVFGGELTRDSDIKIPYMNMIVSLLILTASLGLGLLIQRYKPKLASKMVPLVRPFAMILIIIVVFGGIYVNSFIFRVFEWSILFAGLAVAWGGYLFGAILAAIARLSFPQIIAVSIETAFQNPGVAYVLLQTSVSHPDSDLAAVPIVGQLVATGPPLWVIVTLVYFIKKKLKNKNDNEYDLDECGNKFIDKNVTTNS